MGSSGEADSADPVAAGIGAWRAAVAAGASPLDWLAALRERVLCAAADPAWIHVASADEWRAQMDLLAHRLADAPTPAEALARWPLLGVPFAAKDNIDIAGVPTTAGCPAFAFTPQVHATVVQRLLDAGAVWVGKTNLDQFATGLVGTRSPYGQPACVADAGRISGGSSSGSAVSVARAWATFALGTDTAGSGRVPAGFNGLVGLKPTPGRVSAAGVLPACRTLDCVSVFARHAADAALVLSVLEGADARDPWCDPQPRRAPWAPRLHSSLRIGLPDTLPWHGDAADLGYPAAWSAALDRLRAQGHALDAFSPQPLWAVAELLYSGPWVAERHAVVQPLLRDNPQAIDPVVRTVISQATRFSATDAFEAQYRLRELAAQAAQLWQRFDVLVVPTAPGHPSFDAVRADPVGVNSAMGTWTNFVNLLGWCALALPAGRCAAGLPFGITLVAPAGQDAALARLGARWLDEAVPADAPWAADEPSLPIAVVGAHLSGMPLNGQLTTRGAVLREATTTSAHYRLHALPGTVPPKPGLQRTPGRGAPIALEVWDMPLREVGSFLALIPPPLGLGSVELADGRWVHGFVCEGSALEGAQDITHHGGWRAYMAARQTAASASASPPAVPPASPPTA